MPSNWLRILSEVLYFWGKKNYIYRGPFFLNSSLFCIYFTFLLPNFSFSFSFYYPFLFFSLSSFFSYVSSIFSSPFLIFPPKWPPPRGRDIFQCKDPWYYLNLLFIRLNQPSFIPNYSGNLCKPLIQCKYCQLQMNVYIYFYCCKKIPITGPLDCIIFNTLQKSSKHTVVTFQVGLYTWKEAPSKNAHARADFHDTTYNKKPFF